MAISKHLLFSVLFLVGFLLASSEPEVNRRPTRPPSPRPPSPRPPSPRPPSPRPPSPRPPSPRPPSPRPPSPPPPSPSPSPSPPPPTPPPPRPQPGFEYFLLTLQWPNALCKEKYITCRPSVPKQYFTIHGLWPQKSYSSPQNCETNEQMTNDILDKFRVDLLEYWPRLYSANNFEKSKKFWIEEWNKHGTCSSNKFSPEAYLKAAIALGKAYGQPILSKMKEEGIEPDGITLHTADKILDAIKKATNTAVRITCSNDESGKLQLYDIRICVKDDGETLQDCKTSNPGGNCKGEFIFPSPPTATHTSFPRFLSSIQEVEEGVGL